jgi:hypothetical protein
MSYIKAFVAGFIATLVFHQGLLALLHLLGPAPAPFNMTAMPPFGVPAVLSLAFWGGVWGLPIWLLIAKLNGGMYWLQAIVAGALGPSSVALFIVFPLKGMAFAAGWDPKIIVGALLLNGAWGFGLGLLLKLMKASSGPQKT